MAGKGIKNNEPTAGVTSSSKDENKEITENIGLSTEENQQIAETKPAGRLDGGTGLALYPHPSVAL